MAPLVLQVPHLRYDLTVEDYAADRQAEMDRVRQMLSDDADDTGDTDAAGEYMSVGLCLYSMWLGMGLLTLLWSEQLNQPWSLSWPERLNTPE